MEDSNTLAADCVVISCCCQCLVLQIVIFVLLKLPYKLIRKTREYAKKKLRHRKKGEKIGREMEMVELYKDEFLEIEEFSIDGSHGCGSACMEEVEKVLEELSQNGEFSFGSFWGRGGSGSSVGKHEFDCSVVQYQIIEMVGSFSYSQHS